MNELILAATCGDSDAGVRECALEALGQRGAGLGQAVACLSDLDRLVRRSAVRVLERLGGAQADAALAEHCPQGWCERRAMHRARLRLERRTSEPVIAR